MNKTQTILVVTACVMAVLIGALAAGLPQWIEDHQNRIEIERRIDTP